MWKVPFGVELNNAGESGRLRTSLKSFWCHPFSPCLVYNPWKMEKLFLNYPPQV